MSRVFALMVLAILVQVTSVVGIALDQSVQDGKGGAPGAGPAILRGRAVRQVDGTPIVGATVRCQTPIRIVFCATGWPAEVPCRFEYRTTDDDGRFAFEFPEGVCFSLCSIVVMPMRDTGAAQVRAPLCDREIDRELRPGETLDVIAEVPPSSSVQGVVLDDAGGVVSGVEVLAWQVGRPKLTSFETVPPDVRVVTDALGAFVIPVASTHLRLEVQADGWIADGYLEVSTKPGERITGVPLALHRIRFIEGVVTVAGQAPLADVRVSAYRDPNQGRGEATAVPGVLRYSRLNVSALTDPAGRFRLGPLPHSELQLGVFQQPYLPWSRSYVPDGLELEIALDPGSVITGVVRGPDGQPANGATVQTLAYGGMEAVTGLDGSYAFTGVPRTETGIVGASAPGCALKVAERVRVEAGLVTRLDFDLEPAARLAGRILDAAGKPLAYKTLSIRGDREVESIDGAGLVWGHGHGFQHPSWEEQLRRSETRTDNDGSFHFDHLHAGRYLLRVDWRHEVFEVEAGDDDIELRLRPPDQLRRRLLGNVVDAGTGSPIGEYTVGALYANSGPTPPRPVEQSGSHFVLDLFNGNVQVTIGAPGHAYWCESYDGDDARDDTATVAMQPGHRLDVTILDSRLEPVVFANVTVSSGSGRLVFLANGREAWNSANADGNGKLRLERLPDGVLTVTASDRGRDSRGPLTATATVDLTRSTQISELKFVLTAGR